MLQKQQPRKVCLTFGGVLKAPVGPQHHGWLLVTHQLAVVTPQGVMHGGAPEGCSVVAGADHTTHIRDGKPFCCKNLKCKLKFFSCNLFKVVANVGNTGEDSANPVQCRVTDPCRRCMCTTVTTHCVLRCKPGCSENTVILYKFY
jgi:hypothetical protein